MKIETWNGFPIRFVENKGEWWAVAADIANALGYSLTTNMTRMLDEKDKGIHKVNTTSDKVKCPQTQDMTIISEFGIYEAVFSSHKSEAKDFKRWVFDILKALRQSSRLEGYQVFRMLDKDFQKEQMDNIRKSLRDPQKVDYIKANTIANKAVSIKYGFPKMVKKKEMSPAMLMDRQAILEDTVELMIVKDKFGLDFSVGEQVYKAVSA